MSVVLLGIAFGTNWSQTYEAVVVQPTPPALNHPTPWVHLAPVVTGRRVFVAGFVGSGSISAQTNTGDVSVTGGPSRTVVLLLAVGIGIVAWRRRPSGPMLAWLAVLALSLRCFFEPVMTDYYLAPPLLAALVLAARAGSRRFAVAAVTSVTVTVYSYHHLGEWAWWLPVTAALFLVLACGYPAKGNVWLDGPPGGPDSAEPESADVSGGVDGGIGRDAPAGTST